MTNISVAMATYNGARYLREQLDSIAAQTCAPAELVIRDDGSTDDTIAIVESFKRTAPFLVRVERNLSPLGYGENFIRTASRCSGDWIAFCDQDDVWLPNKLKTCRIEIESRDPDLRLIVHEALVTDDQLKQVGPLYGWRGDVLNDRLALPPETYSLGLTQVFCAKLLRELPSESRLSFPWHAHREAHDVWIALLAGMTGRVLQLAEPLILYRRHGAAVTRSERLTVLGRLQALLRNNGDNFGERADYLEEVSTRLCSLAEQSASATTCERLIEGAAEVRRYSALMRRRAVAYSHRNPLHGAAAIMRLAGAGAYSSSRWSFGGSRLLKDLALVCLPGRSAPAVPAKTAF